MSFNCQRFVIKYKCYSSWFFLRRHHIVKEIASAVEDTDLSRSNVSPQTFDTTACSKPSATTEHTSASQTEPERDSSTCNTNIERFVDLTVFFCIVHFLNFCEIRSKHVLTRGWRGGWLRFLHVHVLLNGMLNKERHVKCLDILFFDLIMILKGLLE